ncbi:MAG: type II 3-dehydroquinate dehydratase [Bacteroides sp.]|nr:type II 3-dehydroquinate dehydratase [Bacillota bacterium]MCM1393310.1 type II 3-dehydroquinate dehydratase [[Eubacterium] siraeum]MCM1455233.1 type II 3-dehydroquinate dehydratase [Bacteroides sp.]
MKKILVINGVNLNMLGIREPDKYGKKSYADLVKYIKACAKDAGLKVTVEQSNHEGRIVYLIQQAYKKYDGIIINAGAYTHTSIAILDALKAVDIPTVEVHLTDIYAREEFRHVSYVSMAAKKTICGKGFEGYKEALEFFKSRV